jgi:hypothetical protein
VGKVEVSQGGGSGLCQPDADACVDGGEWGSVLAGGLVYGGDGVLASPSGGS